MASQSKAQLLNTIAALRAELDSATLTQKKKAEELYISEERFALAMRGANDGLWDWNLQTNEVYYSPRWKAILGYSEDELDNTLDTALSLLHPEDKQHTTTSIENCLSNKTPSFEAEMRMRHKNGGYCFIRSRAFKVYGNNAKIPLRLVGTHVDITARKKSEALAERNGTILEMIAKGSPASDVYNEIALLYEERNPGMRCSMLELSGETLIHKGSPSLPKEYSSAIDGSRYGPSAGSCGTSTYTGELVLVEDISTDPKWALYKDIALPHGLYCCWSQPIKDSFGKVLGAFAMYYGHPALPSEQQLQDLLSAANLTGIVMEREKNLAQIKDLAYIDELTRLPNRTQFYSYLENLVTGPVPNNEQFSLLYIDIDNFKHVNDSLGHEAGDLLLQKCAMRLKEACREDDFVARLSGDEFCIIVNGASDGRATKKVSDRCLKFIAKTTEVGGRELVPSCSIGIANYPADGNNLQSLLKAADTALYHAKDLGKSQYFFYVEELTTKAEYRFKVEQLLRESIGKQLFKLLYQPQFDLETGRITGVEALCRWHHHELGHVPPDEFIDVIERIGLMPDFTEWVLNTACSKLAEWKKSGAQNLQASVNISPSHFLHKDFIPLIKRVLHSTGISPAELELEVTERVIQTNDKNLAVFDQLHDLGVAVAIDDFGTGYSSFASLKHLKINRLKIDKFFVDDMLTDTKTRLLVSSMIEMGHSLGYEVVAEGVETKKQQDMLKELTCDIGQGYLFSKPVKESEIRRLLFGTTSKVDVTVK